MINKLKEADYSKDNVLGLIVALVESSFHHIEGAETCQAIKVLKKENEIRNWVLALGREPLAINVRLIPLLKTTEQRLREIIIGGKDTREILDLTSYLIALDRFEEVEFTLHPDGGWLVPGLTLGNIELVRERLSKQNTVSFSGDALFFDVEVFPADSKI